MAEVNLETVSTTSKEHTLPESDLDSPPESFRLSKDVELEWFDRNAFYYQRKDSTKLVINSSNLNHTTNSQRFSNLNSNPSIIGLPNTQKLAYARRPNNIHNKPETTRLFPEKLVGVESCLVEPSSPNVSCIGRVRSRRMRHRQRSKRSSGSEVKVGIKERKKNGFFESFRAVFSPRVRKPPTKGGNGDDESLPVRLRRGDIRDRLPPTEKDGVESLGVDVA